jgi:hypothetical protein
MAALGIGLVGVVLDARADLRRLGDASIADYLSCRGVAATVIERTGVACAASRLSGARLGATARRRRRSPSEALRAARGTRGEAKRCPTRCQRRSLRRKSWRGRRAIARSPGTGCRGSGRSPGLPTHTSPRAWRLGHSQCPGDWRSAGGADHRRPRAAGRSGAVRSRSPACRRHNRAAVRRIPASKSAVRPQRHRPAARPRQAPPPRPGAAQSPRSTAASTPPPVRRGRSARADNA